MIAMKDALPHDFEPQPHREIVRTWSKTTDIITVGHIKPFNYDGVSRIYNARSVLSTDGICRTITARDYKEPIYVEHDSIIYRLRPCHYFALQGFSQSDFLAAETRCSNTQLYKQTGNSITVNVLETIFSEVLR